MTKKRPLPPDRLAECAAAHSLFLAKKNQLKLSQKKIAEEAGITPAAVNLYFKGINPLNAQFAAVLSRMIAVPVESFSPRLAREIAAMAKAVQVAPGDISSGEMADIVPAAARDSASQDAAKAALEAFATLHIIQAGLLAGVISKEQLQRLKQIRDEIAHQKPGGAERGRRLQGLIEAAFFADENGGSPDDLLRMYQLGMEKEFAKEGAQAHEPGKKSTRRS